MAQVSVIVLTYRSDLEKTKKTLSCAICQQDIDMQIVVCDDGSDANHYPQIEAFFKEHGFSNYCLVDNPVNQGTVRNCIRGIQAANGEYVFLTSPGDFLFDSTVLRDFYAFAKATDAKMCFGNPVRYRLQDGKPVLTSQDVFTLNPHIYSPDTKQTDIKQQFFERCDIIGATYFRRRDFALEYLEAIAHTAKFMEDATSTALALADGHSLYYYDRNIVWYEDGSGISTNGSDRWQKLLREEFKETLAMIRRKHPTDPDVDLLWAEYFIDSSIKRIAYRLLRHPIGYMRMRMHFKHPPAPKPIRCSGDALQKLEQILTP